MLLTGLRGVGKTALLNEIALGAGHIGYHTASIEAVEDIGLGTLIVPHLRKRLFALDRVKGVGDKVKRGLSVLRSFIGAFKEKLSPTRDKLIKKGMIYRLAYGDFAVTVPLFDAFMMRAMPDSFV